MASVAALFQRALAAHQAGRWAEAKADYRRVLFCNSQHVNALHLLGVVHFEAGHLSEAELLIRQACVLRGDALCFASLGLVLKAARRFSEAEEAFRKALDLKPDLAEVHCNLGVLFKETRRLSEAEAAYRRALELAPDFSEVHNNLGVVYADSQRLPEAEAAYRRALEINPAYAVAHNNLGVVFKESGRFADAEAAYRHALELQPDYADAHNNLGVVCKETLRLPEAEIAYRRALELNPDYADARWNLGLVLLTQGRYEEAWACYESRYHRNRTEAISRIPDLPCPQWNDEPIAGKSLVIWPEQGFGDYIQFARYVQLLKARGVTRLTLVCAPPLKALFETLSGVDAVVTDPATLAAHDYWTFSLSLPRHLGSTLDTLPATLPYLHPLPPRIAQWRQRLTDLPGIPESDLKVGLVWQGNPGHQNDAHRSLPGLRTLAPLWRVPGVSFISLQKGPTEDTLANGSAAQPIISLGADIADFADTAAIVSVLDLVICVDTAVAHVAGALGKPVWVLLPATGCDWRWLLERTDSPWYPGVMRLFRQTQAGDWADTLEDVAENLARWRQTAVLDIAQNGA